MVAAVGRIADNIFAGKDINRNNFKRQFGFLGGPQCVRQLKFRLECRLNIVCGKISTLNAGSRISKKT